MKQNAATMRAEFNAAAKALIHGPSEIYGNADAPAWLTKDKGTNEPPFCRWRVVRPLGPHCGRHFYRAPGKVREGQCSTLRNGTSVNLPPDSTLRCPRQGHHQLMQRTRGQRRQAAATTKAKKTKHGTTDPPWPKTLSKRQKRRCGDSASCTPHSHW